jgi:Mg-chelatase subunit ChlD
MAGTPPKNPDSGNKSPAAGNWRSILSSVSDKPITRQDKLQGCVVLLLDTSTSMEGSPLEEARHGASGFARDALAKGYRVGAVGFASHARVLCSLTRDFSVLDGAIAGASADGSTNMTEALQVGAELLGTVPAPRVLCLVTDGAPDDRESTLAQATKIKRGGIEIVTLGTEGADRAFLASLASRQELAQSGTTRTLRADIGRLAGLLPR